MKTNKAILFDYNGVIANDEVLQEAAFHSVAGLYGIELSHRLYSDFCMGRTDPDGFREIKKAYPQEFESIDIESLCAAKTKAYFTLVREKSVIYPNVAETISKLREFFALGIVTSSSIEEFQAVMEKENLLGYFASVVTAEDITKGKPDPEPYLLGIRRLKISVDNTVAIEDSSSGVQSAKSAGLKCIALLHTTPAERLGKADIIVESISNVTPELIISLF